jgi:hypothetical protein
MKFILIDLENVQPAVGELEKGPHTTGRGGSLIFLMKIVHR